MERKGEFTPHCSITSDSLVEAELVKALLMGDFPALETHVPTLGMPLTVHGEPAVILFAFRHLAKAQDYSSNLNRSGKLGTQFPHRTVLLCSAEDAGAAYELCHRGEFDEYVVLWPNTHDPKRLLMVVYRMAADLQREMRGPLKTAESAVRARRVTDRVVRSVQPTPHAVPVVDDSEFQRRIVGSILNDEGYKPLFAVSGKEALTMLQKRLPSLVLLDFQMPDIDGVEVIRQLKADPRSAAVPVIMVSGNGEKRFVLASRELGAVDFIVKPFDRKTLVSKVARVMHLEHSLEPVGE